MGRSGLVKPDWQKDMVYLIQFPRSKMIASFSPFCLKLETWLRMVDIKYENISNNLVGPVSRKGQIPFVEVNGTEIADTYFAIAELTQYFKKDDFEAHLTPMDQANTRAFEALLQESLLWCLMYTRAHDIKGTALHEDIWGSQLTSTQKFLLPIISYKFAGALKTKLFHQGYGRHSWEEIVSIAKRDLTSLSAFLGDKKFFLGDKPSRLDATAFGHLCQHYYTPKPNEIQKFLAEECQSLVAYIDRMKKAYWSDWDEACANLSLDTTPVIQRQ